MQELRPGLWRWTARHPEAEADPEPGSPADWPPDVGSVARYGASLRDALRPLLDLPIELLLVSHGERILSDGREALDRALEA
jgi:hypothetical protein